LTVKVVTHNVLELLYCRKMFVRKLT